MKKKKNQFGRVAYEEAANNKKSLSLVPLSFRVPPDVHKRLHMQASGLKIDVSQYLRLIAESTASFPSDEIDRLICEHKTVCQRFLTLQETLQAMKTILTTQEILLRRANSELAVQ